ncbi:hypothetical protein RHSIM_Rhsim07G0023800 [Rhododendron simsii]|uniref:Alpha/beta hydrolase fold-3 domain-containing protein n=1 Tax=Rhododendron simsii TaxID=118357 RepID=A0A834GND2_RHOSS|nr:hypothetical protein RHSIM_Rhsim07G0023800 [Rhododendron simsii]
MPGFDAYDHLNISLNPDGTLKRHLKIPTLPATPNVLAPDQPTVSKDVTLDADKKTFLRIFRPTKLPSNDTSVAKLPIIIYVHGGGFIDFSPATAMIHDHCSKMAVEIPAVLVSVDYRLAPESRLPAQYEDAVDAILWVKKQAELGEEGDEWLRDYGDFSRCNLYGASNGANIVFHAALRAMDHNLEPMKITGLILNQPMFSGNKRTRSELKFATDQFLPLPAIDLYWHLSLPPGTDRDHRYSNPMADGPHKEKIKSLGRCLVVGFGGDPMVDKQQAFVQMLILEGVPVEARFDNIGFHGIDLIDARRAAALLTFIKEFV